MNAVHNNRKMSGTPKYVFLQQNNNGQYTTYENHTTNNSKSQKNLRNIVLVAAEPVEINAFNSDGKPHTNTANGDNDEELRPLAWLNDSNLIKEIVTTSSATGSEGSTISCHRNLGSNICIVNANSAHDIAEERSKSIAGEDNGGTSIIADASHGNEILDTHVSKLSVTDFQQQFMGNNNHLEKISAISTNEPLSSYTNIPALKTNSQIQQIQNTSVLRDQQKLSYSNTLTSGATTTVHVGPSGTTTVVEYKSNTNFMPSRRYFNSNSISSNVMNNATTITSTNSSNSNKNYSSNASKSYDFPTPSSTPAVLSSTTALSNQTEPCHVDAATANRNSMPGGSCTIKTFYQTNQPETDNNGPNCSNGNNLVSKTHHPHKKYLREKMNSLENGESNANIICPSVLTVVSSPASSTNSLSSCSTSSSTAAVNGGSSPILKSFYAMSSSTSNNSLSTVVHYLNSSPSSSNIHPANGSPTALNNFRHYTVVGQQNNASSNFVASSPEPPDTAKDFYNTPATQQPNGIRSPISYSSFENDSLKDFEISSVSGVRLNTSTPQHQYSNQHQQQSSLKSPSSVHSNTPQKQKHPNNVPYDPLIHTHNKPPYSFSSLIFMAIEGSTEKALPVKEIYAWIVQHFPYFKTAPTGWKNSVRHNLSLNKSFVKVEKAPNMGKGSLWRVEQQQRQNLIQALTRSPFFSNSAVDKATVKNFGDGGGLSLAGYDYTDGSQIERDSTHLHHRFDPPLFPKLAKAFKNLSEQNVLSDIVSDVLDAEIPSTYGTSNKYWNYLLTPNNNKNGTSINGAFSSYESIEHLARDCGADSIEDVNAATAMLALKHGPKLFSENFQNGSAPVITSSPSEDHTYSAGGGSAAGSGASTPVTSGSIISQAIQGSNKMGHGQQNISGHQSNCASSSDAAYESSEENHNNITIEELEDRQRHRDGVDALLSLSVSSVIETSISSTLSTQKDPTSVYLEDESLWEQTERSRSPLSHHGRNANESSSKRTLLDIAAANSTYESQQIHNTVMDEGYNTQSYFGYQNLHQVGLPSPPKKVKPLRGLRTKLKRKAPWMR